MGNVAQQLKAAMEIEGAVGVALVDFDSGLTLGTEGGGPDLDLEVAAAGNTEVIKAKLKALRRLGIEDPIEDILMTLKSQLHFIRLISGHKSGPELFMLGKLKVRGNLMLAARMPSWFRIPGS